MKNRRSLATKLLIKDAFFALLEKKPYNEITVSEICEKCEIGRATFYRHFNVKRDIIMFYFEEQSEAFMKGRKISVITKQGLIDATKEMLVVFRREERIIKLLHQNALSSLFLEFLNVYLVEIFKRDHVGNEITPYLYAGAVFNAVDMWCVNGYVIPEERLLDAMFGTQTCPYKD